MRSLREWIAAAPTAALAAALAVVVIGAGLFGFAIAELTSDDGGRCRPRRPPRRLSSAGSESPDRAYSADPGR